LIDGSTEGPTEGFTEGMDVGSHVGSFDNTGFSLGTEVVGRGVGESLVGLKDGV
jgi:hypothetical protein